MRVEFNERVGLAALAGEPRHRLRPLSAHIEIRERSRLHLINFLRRRVVFVVYPLSSSTFGSNFRTIEPW